MLLKGAVPELSFLAKPHQPNGHDDQMEVDPFETSWIPLLLMGIHGMGSTTGLPMTTTITITMTTALIAMALVTTTLTLGIGILCMWVVPALLSKMARLATIVASSS